MGALVQRAQFVNLGEWMDTKPRPTCLVRKESSSDSYFLALNPSRADNSDK